MTLDEAIKHCEEKEREQALNGCFACAEEHKQLAKWLTELKNMKDCIKTECFICAKDKAISDNAPTVEITEEQAIDKLHETGWLIRHDKEMTERPQGKWIPVSERLPDTLGVYNVTRKLNEGETIYFISGASYFDGQNTWHADTGINHGRPYLTDIIAWQPLPEPYQKGGAE